MPIPCTGPISHSVIHEELHSSPPTANENVSLRDLSNTAGFIKPDAESEFYCLNQPRRVGLVIPGSTIHYTMDEGITWETAINPVTSSSPKGIQCSRYFEETMMSNFSRSATSPAISLDQANSWTAANGSVPLQDYIAVPWGKPTYWYYAARNTQKYYRAPFGQVTSFEERTFPETITCFAASAANHIFISPAQSRPQWSDDSGETWHVNSGVNLMGLSEIVCSASGQYVYMVLHGTFMRSNNYGQGYDSWVVRGARNLTCSTDASGMYVLLIGDNRTVLVSKNYGVNFTDVSLLLPSVYTGLGNGGRKVSYTGKFMVVPQAGRGVYVSQDWGVTWGLMATPVNARHCCVEEGHLLVINPPLVGFYASNVTPLPNTNVRFTDISTGNPTSWLWEFTPATVTYRIGGPTSQHPTVSFNAVGKYTVKLTATNSAGSKSLTKTDYINVRFLRPVADFYTPNRQPIINTNAPFIDISTNGPTSWLWEFSPTTVVYKIGNRRSQNPTVAFTRTGFYTVKLTATNSAGSNTKTKANYVKVLANIRPPVVDFIATKTTIKSGDRIQLKDRSTNRPTSWRWVISGLNGIDYVWDQSNSWTLQHPYVTFLSSGTYDVRLTASNAGGSGTKIKRAYIHVSNNLLSNIVSYYKFVHGDLIDSHGNNNGVVEGNPSSGHGIIDHAHYFNGINNWAWFKCKSIVGRCGIWEHNLFTISMWVKVEGTGTDGMNQVFFSKASTGYECGGTNIQDWMLGMSASKVYFGVGNSSGTGQHIASVNYTMPMGSWVHIAGVKRADKIHLYINAVSVKSISCGTTIKFSAAYPMLGKIACFNGNHRYRLFKGGIDETGYWSRALSTQEMELLYNNGHGYQYPFIKSIAPSG